MYIFSVFTSTIKSTECADSVVSLRNSKSEGAMMAGGWTRQMVTLALISYLLRSSEGLSKYKYSIVCTQLYIVYYAYGLTFAILLAVGPHCMPCGGSARSSSLACRCAHAESLGNITGAIGMMNATGNSWGDR